MQIASKPLKPKEDRYFAGAFAMYDALLFDLDGTLVDSECIALRCNREVFTSLGYQVDDGFLHSLVGRDHPTGRAIIQERFPELDIEALDARMREVFVKKVQMELPLKPYVHEIIAATKGFKRALVTSSGKESAMRKLNRSGLLEHFDVVVTLDDVGGAAKPDPAPYLLACQQLQVDPSHCLVFEDSEAGAQAGYLAGCKVAQIPDILPATGKWNHFTAKDLLAAGRLAGLQI